MPIEPETKNDQDSDYAERNSYKRAKSSRRLLRLDGGRQPPLAQEIPDAHTEMERRGEHPHDKEREVPRILHVHGDAFVSRCAMREPALGVKMPANIRKRDQARVSLRQVEPIPYPRVRRNVRSAAQPNVNPIAAVKEHWQKNAYPFHEQPERNGLKVLRSRIVLRPADERRTVGPEMLRQKCANGK